MMAANMAPAKSDVKKRCWTSKYKNPSRINDLRSLVGSNGTSRDVLKPGYMWSIITCPNPEHDTWVAPSIKRAKS